MKPCTRRVVRMTSWTTAGGGHIRAVVEDDYHHFRVALEHDGTRITRTSADAPRQPYSLCGDAGQRLQELIGLTLSPNPSFASQKVNARLQCTHQFDIAALAMAAAARGIHSRRYDVMVPDAEQGQTTATLARDGAPLFQWEMQGSKILAPEPYAGQDIAKSFAAWVASSLEPDDAEAALIMRRTVFISGARTAPPEVLNRREPRGGCWVHQPERYFTAQPMHSNQDFTNRPEALTADDDEWLAPK